MDNFKLVLGLIIGFIFGLLVTSEDAIKFVNDTIYTQEVVEDLSSEPSGGTIKMNGTFNDARKYYLEIRLTEPLIGRRESEILVSKIIQNTRTLGLKVSSVNSEYFFDAVNKYIRHQLIEGAIEYETIDFQLETINQNDNFYNPLSDFENYHK